jgi:hypothetical protein
MMDWPYISEWGDRKHIRILMGEVYGKRSFGRPKKMWEGNIKMDIRAVRY